MFLLRILTVKNSKKRSAAFACGTNSAGTMELIATRPQGKLKGTRLQRSWFATLGFCAGIDDAQ